MHKNKQQFIGKGVYSNVYEYFENKKNVIKIYKISNNIEEQRKYYDAFCNELYNLSAVQNIDKKVKKHIPLLVDYKFEGHTKENYIVMPKYNHINNKSKDYTETMFRKDMNDLKILLETLNRFHITHNDIKWKNVCRDNKGNIVLIDWNLSKIEENTNKISNDQHDLALMIVEHLFGQDIYEERLNVYEDNEKEDWVYLDEEFYYNQEIWEESEETLYWQTFSINLLKI